MALTRRSALTIVGALLAGQQPQRLDASQTCIGHPEVLTLDLGTGSCRTKTIKVVFGALVALITPEELMSALEARVGN